MNREAITRRRPLCAMLCACLWLAAGHALAERPKIGLALSGGGARGAAHIGVLQVLEENRIPIDCIAGTSMGSIVGGLYAAGYSVDELEAVISEIDWDDAFDDDTPRESRSFRRKRDDDTYLVRGKPGLSDDLELKFPGGLIQGQKIDLLFERLALPAAGITDFDRLPIPYRAVATDIATGDEVVLGSGSLATSMRASMSVPGGFEPVLIGGRQLVDGGVANNLPISVVRELCADVVIAVDISTPLLKAEEIRSVFSVASQLTGFLTRRNTEQQIATLGERDLLIVPDLGSITTADFSKAPETLPIGREAATAAIPKLQTLSVDAATYAAHRKRHDAGRAELEPPVIRFVRLENDSGLGDEVIRRYSSYNENPLIGRAVDTDLIEHEIGRLYGLELFETVTYQVVKEEGEYGVVVKVRERRWGPNYLQAGLDWSTNLNGDGVFNLGMIYSRTLLNELNGEMRIGLQLGDDPGVAAEYYQPLDPGQRWFAGTSLSLASDGSAVYTTTGSRLFEFRVRAASLGMFAGRNFGDWGVLRFDYERGSGEVEVSTGLPIPAEGDFDLGRLRVSLQADTLDSLRFPRRGLLTSLTWQGERESLGSDFDYDQLRFGVAKPLTWKRNTLIPALIYNTTLDDEGSLESFFRGGGFLRLSGFQQDQLAGQHFGLLSLVYYRHVNDFPLFPVYLGGSLESGNVWQREGDVFDDMRIAGSLFSGVDTPLGPLFVAYGLAEDGNDSFYLTLGSPVIIRPSGSR